MINLKPKEFLIHQTSSTEHGINTNYYPSLNEGISLKIFCFPGCSSPAFGNSSPHACSRCVFHVIPKEKQIRHIQGIRYQVPPQDSKNPQNPPHSPQSPGEPRWKQQSCPQGPRSGSGMPPHGGPGAQLESEAALQARVAQKLCRGQIVPEPCRALLSPWSIKKSHIRYRNYRNEPRRWHWGGAEAPQHWALPGLSCFKTQMCFVGSERPPLSKAFGCPCFALCLVSHLPAAPADTSESTRVFEQRGVEV